MNKALIICPVGGPLYHDEAYDSSQHWRFAECERSYDICVISYNDYVPEPGTYDFLIERKGFKFHLVKDVCDNVLRWENYDYIGTWDDDYATDVQSVELALSYARMNDFRLFQQSMISWNTYDCLKHNPKFLWTETNFIETGVPFFRNDIFRKVLAFLGEYRYKKSEWGIDKVLCDVLSQTAHVVHASTAKHMRQESWYSKDEAFQEMNYLTDEFMPKYMKEKYGLDWKFQDRQVAISGAMKE